MDDWKTSFFIAYKSIMRGNKSMLALMIFILALSFLNMMFISGVMSGIWSSEQGLVINLLTADVTVTPQQQPTLKQFIDNEQELRARIQTIPGVVATVRHYLLAGSLSFDKDKNGQYKSISGVITGIDPSQDASVFVEQPLLEGQELSPDDTDQIVLSSAIAGGYGSIERSNTDLGGARVGDKIQVTYSNGVQRIYTVKGIYNDVGGMNETFITAKEAESVLGVSDSASQILVKTDLAKAPVAYYQDRIQAMAPNLVVQNYTSLLGSVASFGKALNVISGIVGAISVAVAAITIFVLIYVNAINKRRQIGILKAIGIKRHIIVNAYVLQSLFYTFCGLAIGAIAVFGLLVPALIAWPIPILAPLMYLTLSFSALGVSISIVAFAVAGYLAGRIPALMVAKEDILTAIWG
ncbi:MAG TPA: FtsX-like permease family protein [Candidatus Paceibacterota bacterium]|nr:FtsX-like permease family protein [Candidatus Paceibacterota bacterium]